MYGVLRYLISIHCKANIRYKDQDEFNTTGALGIITFIQDFQCQSGLIQPQKEGFSVDRQIM